MYGISPFGLAQQLGIEQNVARLYIETYFARYSGVRRYIDRLLEETRREQRVRTLFGRVRPIPDMQSRNANLRGFAERTAVNTPLQGTAADLIKIAMIRIDRRLREEKFQAKMTLQVHDELLFDVPEKEVEQVKQLVRHEMETVIELKVPIVVCGSDCGAICSRPTNPRRDELLRRRIIDGRAFTARASWSGSPGPRVCDG